MRFTFIAAEVWQGIRRNVTMAIAVVIVTFVSLAFVGSSVLLQMQVSKLKDDWFNKVEVSLTVVDGRRVNHHGRSLSV